MDFINEQHVAFIEIGEQTCEVGGLLDGWPAGGTQVAAHRLGNDIGQSGLAQPGRAGK